MYQSGYPEDRLLFSTRLMEGEFVTWTHVWTVARAYLWQSLPMMVDNFGTCWFYDAGTPQIEFITEAGVATVLANHIMFLTMRCSSVNRKYVLVVDQATPTEFDVYRDNVFLFSRDTLLDEADGFAPIRAHISPDGRFILVTVNVNLGPNDYALLYRGS